MRMITHRPMMFRREPLMISAGILTQLRLLDSLSALEQAMAALLATWSDVRFTGEDISALLEANPKMAHSLKHRLSAVWLSRRPLGAVRDRRDQQAERLVTEESKKLLISAIQRRSVDAFMDWAKLACGLHTGTRFRNFRTHDVYAEADRDGTSVAFPDHRTIKKQLTSLFECVVSNLDRPFLAAIIGQLLFLNAHPFADGNGRCARTLFNVVLGIGQSSCVYVPLRAFIEHGDGAFEIGVRQIELNADWADLLKFHQGWVQLLHKLFEVGLERGQSVCTEC